MSLTAATNTGARVPGSSASPQRPPRLTPPPTLGSTAASLILLALLAASIWAFIDLGINVATLVDGVGRAVDFAGRVFPLSFPPPLEILRLCVQTLGIVILATLLSTVLSIPLALFAATNTTPNQPSRIASRALIVVMRAIPDVVLAIMFVRVFGIGPITGVLAMGLHSIGMIGKMFGDAVEQVDEGPVTAMRAAGGSRLQQISGAVLPQVLPAFVAVALHRLDINLRVSVVLGFVGVGGIGFAIAESLKTLNYHRGIALALVVLLLCIIVELISGAIRTRLLGRGASGTGIIATLTRRFRRAKRIAAADASMDVSSDLKRDPRLRSAAALMEGRISPPWDRRRITSAIYTATTVAIVVASFLTSGISLEQFFASLPGMFTSLGYFLPPEGGGILPALFTALWVTVEIALAATLIGAVLSLPIGAMAARNVAPSLWVAQLFRLIILLIRGVPELILAIIFVVITGLGEVAGTIALGVGAVGLLGKLIADSLEEIDPGPPNALTASGGSRFQVFFAATVPAGTKAIVAHVLYLLDTNIRSATLLGIVGAGGIGYYLLNASRVLEFGVVTTILIMVFCTVMLVELLAIWLRGRF